MKYYKIDDYFCVQGEKLLFQQKKIKKREKGKMKSLKDSVR